MRRLAAVLLAALIALGSAAAAVEPGERLDDPALEARARDISRNLRCLVCQNQSIDDSNADLARDLRLLVRRRLLAGDDDAAVIAYVTDRYGDFVLLRPPFQPNTWLLWLTPLAVLALGAGGLGLAVRQRRRAVPEAPPLSPEERARIEEILGAEGARTPAP
jgi:cytochrome c-type biogenesis protein CcmH